MNHYKAKQAARKARFEELAEQARNDAASAHDKANELARYSAGTPILVGHHSEQRHRRHLERIWNSDAKAHELSERAAHYEAKAEAVGKGGISGGDPDALEKLQAELAEHTVKQERMKTINNLVKRGDQAAVDAFDLSDDERWKMKCGGGRFPAYTLTNNGAALRRIKARIADLEAIQAMEDLQVETDLYTYTEDRDDHTVEFEFKGKPSEEIRALLKSGGFQWAPSRGVWVRQHTSNGIHAGRHVCKRLDAMRELLLSMQVAGVAMASDE